MDNKEITKFLEENACRTKSETLIRVVRKFNLSKEKSRKNLYCLEERVYEI